MSLTMLETQALSEVSALALGVAVVGMKITVSPGSFRIAGEDHELTELQEFDAAADLVEETTVDGWLVLEKATGDVVVLVEERIGLEAGYGFPPDGPYQLLELLFMLKILPGTTDLGNTAVTVRKIVE